MLCRYLLADGRDAEIDLIGEAETLALRLAVLRPGKTAVDLTPRISGSLILGARMAGRLIATLCVSPLAEPGRSLAGQWRLLGMATEASCRGLGIGGALLDTAIALLRERDDAAWLWCDGRLEAASFYLRHGFHRAGESRSDYGPHLRFRRAIA
jgi:GNAT superfamily N-acetyltransferase